jgi:hypothetical protein
METDHCIHRKRSKAARKSRKVCIIQQMIIINTITGTQCPYFIIIINFQIQFWVTYSILSTTSFTYSTCFSFCRKKVLFTSTLGLNLKMKLVNATFGSSIVWCSSDLRKQTINQMCWRRLEIFGPTMWERKKYRVTIKEIDTFNVVMKRNY